MAENLTTIGFDADDTLWQNERFYRAAEARFAELLADYADCEGLETQLNDCQRRNTPLYGFGAKSFTLSLIETAIEISDGDVPATALREIINMGREMLDHPVELLPNAREVVEELSGAYRILLITKGDLFHQERKIAASLLGEHFDAIEIVSEKTPDAYRKIFSHYGDDPQRAMMIGNSLKSDVIPALEAGSWGVHIPHDQTWSLERAEPPSDAPRYRRLENIAGAPGLITEIS